MGNRVSQLLGSEKEALEVLRQRIVCPGRAETLVIAGPVEVRLGLVLRALVDRLGGRYLDLASRDGLRVLQDAPPLYGRDIGNQVSASALRHFLVRGAAELDSGVLA